MSDLAHLLTIAQAATQRGAELIRTNQPTELTAKGDRDYSSNVDIQVERELREFLASATPDIGFLGEEEGASGGNTGRHWALDPIDGTINFANAIPLCAVSLALIEGDQAVLGIIQLPFLDRTYAAALGLGATRDGKPITVAKPARLSGAVVTLGDYAVGEGAQAKNVDRLAVTQHLAGAALRLRMLGSAAIDLAWLAEGLTGAAVMLGNRPWDTAAGVIIAREAGARVTDIDGTHHTTRSGATIAATPTIADELIAILKDATWPVPPC